MYTRGPQRQNRSRTLQILDLVIAALAAVVIAMASQGWLELGPRCHAGSACFSV